MGRPKGDEYYWNQVTTEGNKKWKCKRCKGTFSGGFTRIKAHIQKEKGKGIAGCSMYCDNDGVYNVSNSSVPQEVVNMNASQDGLQKLMEELEKELDAPEKHLGKMTENVTPNDSITDEEAEMIELEIMEGKVSIRMECMGKIRRQAAVVRLMTALMELDLDVQHSTASVVNDSVIQLVTATMGTRLFTQEQLRSQLCFEMKKLKLKEKKEMIEDTMHPMQMFLQILHEETESKETENMNRMQMLIRDERFWQNQMQDGTYLLPTSSATAEAMEMQMQMHVQAIIDDVNAILSKEL